LSERWFDLLRIQFEKLTLPEAVISVRLEGGRAQALHAESGRLVFRGKTASKGIRFSIAQLLSIGHSWPGNPAAC
jgi:hypothetical protein